MENNKKMGVSGVSILKYIVLALILVFAIWLFWRENPSGTVFGVVTSNLESSGFMDNMEVGLAEEGQMILGIGADDCMNFFYASTEQQGDSVELAVIQTDNDRKSSRVIKALENHIDDQVAYFETNDYEQTALLKNAILKRQGTYILYAVSEDAVSLEKEFLSSLK